jgi:hypothetical protein
MSFSGIVDVINKNNLWLNSAVRSLDLLAELDLNKYAIPYAIAISLFLSWFYMEQII